MSMCGNLYPSRQARDFACCGHLWFRFLGMKLHPFLLMCLTTASAQTGATLLLAQGLQHAVASMAVLPAKETCLLKYE